MEDGGATRMPDASFAALRATARRMRTSRGGGVILAAFREGGAAPFFALPLHELFGATVPLDVLVPRADVERTADRIHAAPDARSRAALFEEFLLARLNGRQSDPVVAAAARAIRAEPAAIRVRDLARRLGLSAERLEKRFRRVVGASPKRLASILRVRRAVESYRPGTTLTRLAAEAGYFDQSHFIRELRAVTGEPPGRFFAGAEAC